MIFLKYIQNRLLEKDYSSVNVLAVISFNFTIFTVDPKLSLFIDGVWTLGRFIEFDDVPCQFNGRFRHFQSLLVFCNQLGCNLEFWSWLGLTLHMLYQKIQIVS